MRDLIERLWEEFGAKGAKFLAVTAFNVVFGQSLLFGAQLILDWDPLPSNVFAVTISAFPAYLLSRYWVWQKTSKNMFWREIVPFWALAVLGLVISTAAVWAVESNWEDVPPVAVNLTNLAAFGVLWVAKFFIFDRILFVHVHDPDDAGDPDDAWERVTSDDGEATSP